MAAVDYFLKLDGIEGESADSKHKGEIDVTSWSMGGQQQGTGSWGGGSGAGKVNMHDLQIVASHSKASPKLFLAMTSGQHIKSGILTCRKAGGDQQEFLKITLTDVLVSSYKTGGGGVNGTVSSFDIETPAQAVQVLPTDQFTLNFAKIEHEYKEQKADGTAGGSVKAGWDLKANKKV